MHCPRYLLVFIWFYESSFHMFPSLENSPFSDLDRTRINCRAWATHASKALFYPNISAHKNLTMNRFRPINVGPEQLIRFVFPIFWAKLVNFQNVSYGPLLLLQIWDYLDNTLDQTTRQILQCKTTGSCIVCPKKRKNNDSTVRHEVRLVW